MTLLLYGFGILVMLGFRLAFLALRSAQGGYQDEQGYHDMAPAKAHHAGRIQLPPLLPTV